MKSLFTPKHSVHLRFKRVDIEAPPCGAQTACGLDAPIVSTPPQSSDLGSFIYYGKNGGHDSGSRTHGIKLNHCVAPVQKRMCVQ